MFERVTRFGVFPARRIGRFTFLNFTGGTRKFTFVITRSIDVGGGGLVNLIALNVGRFLVMYESPVC